MLDFEPSQLGERQDPLSIAPWIWVPYPDRRLSPNGRAHFVVINRLRQSAKMHARGQTLGALGRDHPWRRGDLPSLGWRLELHALPIVERGRDDDNLISSLKAHRDGVAMALGVDDSRFSVGDVVFWPAAAKSRWRPGVVIQIREVSNHEH